jgi:hypothetical protein
LIYRFRDDIDMRDLIDERDQLLEIAHQYESQLSERERKIQQLSQVHTQVNIINQVFI